MIEVEEYKVLQQHPDEDRLIFDKLIRLSDEVIYELNVTETVAGKLIHTYCEGNNYRKLILVFMDSVGGNNYFKLSDAPLPIEIPKIVYWGANTQPPQMFWDREIVMLGDKAREYHSQVREWEHEIFVFNVATNTFFNRNSKKITDFKYLFKM